MCVPDVVLNDFPTGFSVIGGSAVEKSFAKLESAIEHGEYFVTYSERVKWDTLVRRYGADPESVFVIRHGANRLDDLVRVTGFPDNAAATDRLCRRLLATALQKDVHRAYEGVRVSTGIRFIFYASQFRPNKNIISLLRAYDYLLRRRFVGHKLILTGIPIEHDEVSTFIAEKNLQQDVLCLHNLNEQELAACYHLADLAVNPSLSEGGCPFTFTEAMSVGTPVVMARIPVTEEVITDPNLQAAMLFDPFDWRDMAARIEYGLLNRDKLRVLEQPFYEQLARRSWGNVVDDYVAILGRISTRKEALHAGV
jgi:glycosyltransferase involved in cell wall biosynthesis